MRVLNLCKLLLYTSFLISTGAHSQIVTLGNEISSAEGYRNGAYCPNSNDDLVGSGGNDFNGRVKIFQKGTWRIETGPDYSNLYLNIDFKFQGIDNPNVYVEGKRTFRMFGYTGLDRTIVGFRQERADKKGFNAWKRSSSNSIVLDLPRDGGIFCDDDNGVDYTADITGGLNDIYFSIDIQGDTGGADISEDRDCACDTRVLKISWDRTIQVAYAVDVDRDGVQDKLEISGLPVDNNVVNINENKSILSVSVARIKTKVHNNDCRRIQGKVKLELYIDNGINGEIGPIMPIGSDVILDYPGNKRKDFSKHDVKASQGKIVSFILDEDVLRKGNYYFKVDNDLKRCHKKCDLCSGYNCSIIYLQEDIDGLPFGKNEVHKEKVFYLTSNFNGTWNLAGHDLSIDIVLTRNTM